VAALTLSAGARRALIALIAYGIAAQIGYVFTGHGYLAPIWPAAAVVLGAAILYGPSSIVGICLYQYGYFVLAASSDPLRYVHALACPIGLFIVTTLTAKLLARWRFDSSLSTLPDLLRLIVGTLLFPALAASVNTITACSLTHLAVCTKVGWLEHWLQTCVAFVFGCWICLPALLSWSLRLDPVARARLAAPSTYWLTPLRPSSWELVYVGVGIATTALAWSLVRYLGIPVQVLGFSAVPLLVWAALSFPPLFVHSAILGTGLVIVTLQIIMPNQLPGDQATHIVTLLLTMLSVSMLSLLVSVGVQQQQALTRKLSYQARHDPLTKLFNRPEMERQLAQLEASVQDGHHHAFCYVDLDKFQIVNDTCGHAVGDKLLAELGQYLQANMRPGDTLGRLGGDEFGILMVDVSLHEAEGLAETLCNAIERFRFTWEGKQFSLEASAGVAPIDSHSRDIHPVVAADTACAFAKQGGSRRVVCYSADNEDLRQHRALLAWVPRIRAALAENRLCIYCQPIVPLCQDDGKRRFEVLVRMVDENGRLAPPGEFIPAAEHFGLMPALDLWVIRTTLAWLEGHPEALATIAHCGINLSGASIGETDFRAGFQTLLMHTQVPLDQLCFEITETAAIYHLDRVGDFVASLRSLGAKAALDDFGVGLSSFGYLKQVPVDYIKVDGSFITHILDNPVDAAMVRAIHEVAQAMGVQSIAEYVENSAVAQHLGTLGIAYGQGWHFGKPIPIDEYFASAANNSVRAPV